MAAGYQLFNYDDTGNKLPVELGFMQQTKPEPVKGKDSSEEYYRAMPDATFVDIQAKTIPANIISPEDRDLLDLRHGYLHFSAKYDRSAGIIIPNYPCIDDDGHRKRLILPG